MNSDFASFCQIGPITSSSLAAAHDGVDFQFRFDRAREVRARHSDISTGIHEAVGHTMGLSVAYESAFSIFMEYEAGIVVSAEETPGALENVATEIVVTGLIVAS